MNIRPFNDTDEDYIAWIDLSLAINPEVHLTVELLREDVRDCRAQNHEARFLGEVDDQVIAFGMNWQPSRKPDAPYEFSFSIHPEYRAGNVPQKMHDHLLTLIERENPSTIASYPKENEPFRKELLEASGFDVKMRFPESRLSVEQVDLATYEELMDKLQQQGIEFVTLTDVMETDSEWQRNVWQMFSIIERDIPSAEPEEPTSFEEYSEYYTEELFRPDSWIIAVDSGLTGAAKYVGMCVVNIMPTKPKSLYAGITGVIPSHRRRKIATVLKINSVKYAQKHGYEYIETDNEENNPMYDLNMQLGFEPLPAVLYYRKEMS
ncbi:MAG: GNAT family N-acetyltransferase [Chloroflexota bacterium]